MVIGRLSPERNSRPEVDSGATSVPLNVRDDIDSAANGFVNRCLFAVSHSQNSDAFLLLVPRQL